MMQIGEGVSRSKQTLLDFLSSTSLTSLFISVGVTVLVTVIAIMTVIILQLRASYQVQEALLKLQHDTLEETAKRNAERDTFLHNMIALEEVVYGKLEPVAKEQLRQPTSVARVPLVRLEKQMQDAVLRITQLERARLELQSRVRKLEDELQQER